MLYPKIFFLLLILGSKCCLCQFEDDYAPLNCSGPIPSNFLNQTSENYDEQKKKIDIQDSRFVRRAQEEFLLMSNFRLRRAFTSGRIIFGDEVSEYLGKILNELLKDDYALRRKVSIFALKSSMANAFATDQGYIFITTGLISRLENEAQLAFIISHELSHFVEDHTMEQYVENKKILADRSYYYRGYDAVIAKMSSFSQDHEMDADSKGLERMIKSNYRSTELLEVFDILKYTHLPFAEDSIDFKRFTDPNFSIQESWMLTEVRSINEIELDSVNEEFSSHPALYKRSEAMFSEMEAQELSGREGKLFIQSEHKFKRIKEICRFEDVRLNLELGDYLRAIYECLLLQKKYPKNLFLKESLALGFYGLYKKRKFIDLESCNKRSYVTENLAWADIGKYDVDRDNELRDSIFGDLSEVQGQEHALHHFTKNMSKEQLNVYTIKFLLEIDSTRMRTGLNNILDDALYDLQFDHGWGYQKIADGKMQDSLDVLEAELCVFMESSDSLTRSKSDKVKLKNMRKELKRFRANHFHDYILSRYKSKRLETLFNKILDKVDKNREWHSSNKNLLSVDKSLQVRREDWEEKWGDYLGIDSLLTISPYYLRSDGKTWGSRVLKKEINYLKSESKETAYSKLIRNSSKKLDIMNEFLVFSEMDTGSTDKFNDMTMLTAWVDERLGTLQFDMIPTLSAYSDEIIAKYGTSNIYYSGAITEKMTKSNAWRYFITAIPFFWPVAPCAVITASISRHQTVMFHFVFDIENGDVNLANVDVLKKQLDHAAILQSQIYGTMYKIKHVPKKEYPYK